MGTRKKTFAERTYRTNVFSDGLLSQIEGLDNKNLMPQNTDFEQIASLNRPEPKPVKRKKGSRPFTKDRNHD